MQMQKQTERPLKLTAKYAIVMLADDFLQICVGSCTDLFVYVRESHVARV